MSSRDVSILVSGEDGHVAEALAACAPAGVRVERTRGVAPPEHEARCDILVAAGGRDGPPWGELARFAGEALFVAAVPSPSEAAAALAAGADDFLVAPADEDTLAPRLAALVRRAARHRALLRALELADVAVEFTDARGRLEYVGAAFERFTGYGPREALGRTPAELLRGDAHPPSFYDAIWAQISAGEPWSGRMVSRRRDGGRIVQKLAVVPVLEGGRCRNFLALKRETTELETALSRQRALMEMAADAILVADVETERIVEANAAARELLGYSHDELREETVRMLAAPGAGDALEELVRTLHASGRAEHRELRLRRRDGTEFWADVRMTLVDVVTRRLSTTILRDVTDRVERERELSRSYRELQLAQEQLLQSSRLAAVGELAAGVAHEVNNPAAFVLLNLHAARRWIETAAGSGPPSLDELRALVEESIEGAQRIAAISGDLRTFSRLEPGAWSPVEPNDVVRVALRMASNQLRHRAEVLVELADVPKVQGDAGRLVQVLVNLLVNAGDALDAAPDVRRIVVRTRAHRGEVAIDVEDTGPGVAAEHRERIFEPFFSTKPEGVGTGLGLSLSRTIVEEHGGRIALRSEPGTPTCFTLHLPAVAAGARREVTRTSAPPPPRRSRVLIVDDDPLVLRALARSLRDLCDVLTAPDARRALDAVLDAHVDLVICDLMMPGTDGQDVYEAVGRLVPRLRDRFLFCSGGAFTPRARSFLESTRAPVLAKPVAPAELRRTVLEALRR